MSITRRTDLAAIPACACGFAPVVPASAAPMQTEIEELFSRWLVVANGQPEPSEEENWGESRYVRLQASILAAEPVTPRDVAIQFFVDTDQMESDRSDHFDALVTRLVETASPAPGYFEGRASA